MIEVLTNFVELKKHVKESGLQFKEAILDYYKTLGENQSYSVVDDALVVKNGLEYGRIGLAWVEPQVTFNLEFGLLEDIYKHLFLNMALEPGLAVFILSSNSKCKPSRVVEIIAQTPQLENLRKNCLVLDLEKEQVVYS